MKRISILLVFVLSALVANAWSRKCDEAAMIVASEHLSPTTKKLVKKYLGKSYTDDVHYLYDLEAEQAPQLSKKARQAAAEVHYLHLDKDLQPKSVKGKDALKSLEAALEVVRNHTSHPKREVTAALREVINLVCDMHNLSKIRIDGIKHSQRDFWYLVPRAEFGKKKSETSKVKWSRSWRTFDGGYSFFSANYWAEDLRVYIGGRYADYATGTPREWASEYGAFASRYLEMCKPKQTVGYMDRREMFTLNYEMYVKTTCRLAALLNENLK